MDKTDNFKDDFRRFYRQTANLNLYIQNARKVDTSHVAAEIKSLTTQLEYLRCKFTTKQS